VADASSSSFKVEGLDIEGGGMIRLSGVIDEHPDLSFLSKLKGRVHISLKGVRRINSFGVRAWIDAIRRVPAEANLEFIECPPPVIDQINMVAGFLGRGKVLSFFAPMTCDKCDVEINQLFQTAEVKKNNSKLPAVKCPKCGGGMEVDDLEDQYLLFVRDQ